MLLLKSKEDGSMTSKQAVKKIVEKISNFPTFRHKLDIGTFAVMHMSESLPENQKLLIL